MLVLTSEQDPRPVPRRACISPGAGDASRGRYLQMVVNAAMTRDQPASEDGQNWQFCAADRGDLATLQTAQIRR